MAFPVLFRKPDLDTVLTGRLLLAHRPAKLVALRGHAPLWALKRPDVLCLECGGSDWIELSDFDHHDGDLPLPCAAEQAWDFLGRPRDWEAIVRHVADVDTGAGLTDRTFFRDRVVLSTLFSGMRLVHTDARASFRAGLRLLDTVHASGADPLDLADLADTDPDLGLYLRAKRDLARTLEAQREHIRVFWTGDGPVLALVCPLPGVHGLLRREGALVSVAGSVLHPGVFRWTVSFTSLIPSFRTALLAELGGRESGWGGPVAGTVVGSPFAGSRLPLEDVVLAVKAALHVTQATLATKVCAPTGT